MYKILAKTLFVGKKLVFLPSCHSTNEVASQMLKDEKLPEGTIIITNNQTAGKGQRGNSWEAQPEKNLTFSMILRPQFLAANQQFQLNMSISLGILDFLNQYKNGFLVKWPNDIYYHEQKIAGILIQNNLKASNIETSVVGIGLNINQEDFSHPRATSLKLATSKELTLQDSLDQLGSCLESRYIQLKKGDAAALKNEYLNQMLGFCEDRLFKADEIFNGKITGIDKDGRLEIETSSGLRYFAFKEVAFL